MSSKLARSAWRLRWVAAGGVLFQQGCVLVDPDLPLNAVIQFLTELAIFFTDAAFVSVR